MVPFRKEPRILVVTPEVSFLPDRSGAPSEAISARAGGLGDVTATLIQSLYTFGVDVHVAMPNYRQIFRANTRFPQMNEACDLSPEMPAERIHLVQDRLFYYLPRLLVDKGWDTVKVALAFQREVINRIVPIVQPDLIHCHGWMTGLIPAMARESGIPCLFTLYNVETVRLPLAAVEDCGIDAASFWQHCYFERMPLSYEETRNTNPVDFLVSAVFASHFVNTLSPSFSRQILEAACGFVEPPLRRELQHKQHAGCLASIEHAPPPHFNPAVDNALCRRYGPEDHPAAKAFNKLALQENLRLRMDSGAPLFFWPSRLERGRGGCRLIIDLLPGLLADYAAQGLQLVFIADGNLHPELRALIAQINATDRVAVADFDSRRYRLAFAAADFVLLPMHHEPCGLSCKIAHRYGALPIGHDTGGIHDALSMLEAAAGKGNGFVFENFDINGLRWAIGQAMTFHGLPNAVRAGQVGRIMAESLVRYDHESTARAYIELYERMLQRPFGHLGTDRRCAEMQTLQEAA